MKLPFNQVIQGDCLVEMKKLPADSIDTVITDPPYGIGFMGKEWDNFKPDKIDEAMAQDKRKHTQIASQRRSNTAGTYDLSLQGKIGFQNWMTKWAIEALRVTKPGGTMLIFGGTRTYHRLACAIEDAGWIIKDCIMWIYAQGFPKSLNISKQIDKRPNIVLSSQMRDRLNEYRIKRGLSVKQVNEHFGFATTGSGVVHHWMTHPTQPTIPTEKQYKELKKLLEIDDKDLDKLYVEAEREIIGKDKNWGKKGSVPISGYKEFDITKSETENAKLWEGWGTSLKPAYEPILVAMKPNEGSYAQNALKHKVAGLNIDGGRVKTEDKLQILRNKGNKNIFDNSRKEPVSKGKKIEFVDSGLGRFPANIILDQEAAKMLPNGASRFFYTAKSSREERNRGVLDSIVSIDIIREWKENNTTQEEKLAQLLVGMDNSRLRATVVSGIANKSVIEWSTEWFGKKLMEKYRKDFVSIIETEINSITPLITLLWLICLFTREYTEDVKLEMGSGGSPVVGVENYSQLTITIKEKMASRLGVKNVVSGTQLKINAKDGTNFHPTCKPLKLMEYLCELTKTPTGGVVLDPFAGSGTTGMAAKLTKRDYILIEKEKEYCEIAEARIKATPKPLL